MAGKLKPDFLCGGDGNENICGACLKFEGLLICCENCPAAYHPECAGYANLDDVPEGDWYCWTCAKKRGLKFPPVNAFSKGVGNDVMISLDKLCEVFYKGRVVKDKGAKMVVSYDDQPPKKEEIGRRDERVWCGSCQEAAWNLERGGAYRPKSRAYEVDFRFLGVAGDVPKVTGIQEIPGKASAILCEGGVLSKKLEKKKTKKREKQFMKALGKFWEDKMGCAVQFPVYGYVVPLSELWEAVGARGGYCKVCADNLWKDIGRELDGDATVKHLPFVVKNTYKEALFELEKSGGQTVLDRYTGKKGKKKRSGEGKDDRKKKKRKQPNPPPPQISEVLAKSERTGQECTVLDLNSAIIPAGMKIREVDEPIRARKSNPPPNSDNAEPGPSNRAVNEEQRRVVGAVEISDTARRLSIGDTVEARTWSEGHLGPWCLGKIISIAPGSFLEGYRRFRIRWYENVDREEQSIEWVPLLSRLSSSNPYPEPIVMVRLRHDASFPSHLFDPSGCKGVVASEESGYVPKSGDRVEAWWRGGWWGAKVTEVQEMSGNVILQGDPIPVGAGIKLSVPRGCLRRAHSREGARFDMILPPEDSEKILLDDLKSLTGPGVEKTRSGSMVVCYPAASQLPSVPKGGRGIVRDMD